MELNEYLDQLLEELHKLGVNNAYQIVATTEEEIKKRQASQSLNSILEGLGTPQEYAMRFKDKPASQNTSSTKTTNAEFREPVYKNNNTRNILIGVLVFIVFFRFAWFIVSVVFRVLGFATWGAFSILGTILRYSGDFFFIGAIVLIIILLLKNKNAS